MKKKIKLTSALSPSQALNKLVLFSGSSCTNKSAKPVMIGPAISCFWSKMFHS